MKKQLTAWLLALVMLFSLVGCGADAPVQDDSSLPQQEQQTVELVKLSRQIVELSREMEAKWSQKSV